MEPENEYVASQYLFYCGTVGAIGNLINVKKTDDAFPARGSFSFLVVFNLYGGKNPQP